MARKVTIRRHDLSELLQRLREEARMSREQLAEAGGLSVGPIKRIETEGHVPKPFTLQLIAEGLATYAPGRRDEQLARDYYSQLMLAAGYTKVILEPDDVTIKSLADQADEWTESELKAAIAQRVGAENAELVDHLMQRLEGRGAVNHEAVLRVLDALLDTLPPGP